MEEPKPKKPRPSRAIPGATRGGSKPHGPAPLTEGLRLRMTPEQLAAVEGAAKVAGVGPQEWIRRAIGEALTRADHACLTVAHLDAVGGMPSATD